MQNRHVTVASPAFQAAIADVARTVAPMQNVHNLRSPHRPANRDQVSRDGHTALVEWDMSGKLKAAEKQIDPLTGAVASVGQRGTRSFYIGEAGAVSSGKALNKLFNAQLGTGGRALGAADAADPGAGVRVAAGRVDPADARPAGRDRHRRPDRHRQPHHADGPEASRPS